VFRLSCVYTPAAETHFSNGLDKQYGYGRSVTDTDQRVWILQLTGEGHEDPGSQLNNLLSTFRIPSTFKVKAVNNDTAECPFQFSYLRI